MISLANGVTVGHIGGSGVGDEKMGAGIVGVSVATGTTLDDEFDAVGCVVTGLQANTKSTIIM